MAKKKKTAVRVGPPKPPKKAPDVKIETQDEVALVEEKADSNCGNFLDDDAYDFVQNLQGGVQKDSSDNVSLKSSLVTKTSIASHAPEATALALLPSHASTTPVNNLENQLKSLKTELEAKDRELKGCKNKITTLYATLEDLKKTHSKELSSVRSEISAEYERSAKYKERSESQCRDFKKQLDEVEERGRKAVEQFHDLSDRYETLKAQKKESQRKLHIEIVKVGNLQTDLENLNMEKRAQEGRFQELVGLGDTLSQQIQLLSQTISTERQKRTSLQSQVSSLTAQNSKLTTQISTASRSNRPLNDELIRVQNQCRNLKNDVNASKKKIYNLKDDVEYYRTQRNSFRDEVDAVKQSLLQEKLDSQYYKSQQTKLRSKLNSAKHALETEKGYYDRQAKFLENSQDDLRRFQDKCYDLKNEVKALKMELSESKEEILLLEKDRDLKAPLVKVGVDIRLRYLEQAKESVPDTPRCDLNEEIIQKGDIAAHRANVMVDAAVFQSGLVPQNHQQDALKIFNFIYKVSHDPARCLSMSSSQPLTTRAKNSVANVLVLKIANKTDEIYDELSKHQGLKKQIIELVKVTLSREREKSKSMKNLVNKLEEVEENIMILARPRGRRY